jgi:RNA polymerase sigma factor (sigma-70 family)
VRDDRDRVVLDHDRLACALAEKFRWCGENIDDLQQVAREALIVAAHRFDPARGVRFSTYAYSAIWGRLMRHIRDDLRLIRHPRTVHMAGGPYLQVVSLESMLDGEDSGFTLESTLGVLDGGFDAVECHVTLRQVLAMRSQEDKAALSAGRDAEHSAPTVRLR